MIKIYLTITLLILTSCTSIKVQSLNPDLYKVYHVCIERNPKVIVEGFPGVIERGLERHGITSELYTDTKPNHCEYSLTYTALQTWDMSTYLHHAELRLYKGNQKIAYAEYHLNGKGGLSLNKWASVDSKMAPLIDQLLSGYSPEIVNDYRKPVPDTSLENSPDDNTKKLIQLKEWHEKGLISDEEYKSQKQKTIEQ